MPTLNYKSKYFQFQGLTKTKTGKHTNAVLKPSF